jgi:hypothetical protein
LRDKIVYRETTDLGSKKSNCRSLENQPQSFICGAWVGNRTRPLRVSKRSVFETASGFILQRK